MVPDSRLCRFSFSAIAYAQRNPQAVVIWTSGVKTERRNAGGSGDGIGPDRGDVGWGSSGRAAEAGNMICTGSSIASAANLQAIIQRAENACRAAKRAATFLNELGSAMSLVREALRECNDNITALQGVARNEVALREDERIRRAEAMEGHEVIGQAELFFPLFDAGVNLRSLRTNLLLPQLS